MKAFLNDVPVRFTEGETILEVARREGVFIPTLCEFAALHHRPGTCRMCLVEIVEKDRTRTVTACDTRMKEGLRVRTTGAQLRSMRKLQAELLFADHCERCSECPRHGDCELQTVAKTVGLDVSSLSGRFVNRHGTDDTAPALTFTPDKCIRCLRCLEVCRQVHGVGAITLEGFGTEAAVGFDGTPWGASDRCIQCGQCSLVCPTGAIAVKDQCERALELFEDPSVTTVVQMAPAVRFTFGEAMGLPAGENLEGFLVAGLKKLGADLVCDTRWSADVTILEEGTELIERLEKMKRENRLDRPDTMFTSCCPGWINHVEKSAADLIDHISTTRSPQGIFGALAKTWLPRALKIDKERIRVISIMPCTAKKDEAARPALSRDGMPDVDLVLTVRELAEMADINRGTFYLSTKRPYPRHGEARALRFALHDGGDGRRAALCDDGRRHGGGPSHGLRAYGRSPHGAPRVRTRPRPQERQGSDRRNG
jgi:ferredoxin hydrogenase gamma subunit